MKAASGTVEAFEVYAANVTTSNATQLQIVLDEIAEEAHTGKLGDVNRDGEVNITDVTLLIAYVLDPNASPDIDLDVADVNNDTNINITDITLLIGYVLNDTW